jgi:serine-type D-Ala-D-Ala carboxypeptidase/endopeptidase
MHTIRRCIIGLTLAVGFALRLFAADSPILEDVIREHANRPVEKKAVVGLVVGVIDGDKTYTACVGRQSKDGPAPDEKTVFEIGSITKVFTGQLLADAVIRGEVNLDQPVAELLGKDVVVPKFDGRPIRLVDLATQTSGLPRLPDNLNVLANPLNPYADYKVDDLLKFLAEHKLRRSPGDEFEYSNLGMGLLGTALAKHSGKTYEALAIERICKPLGMDDTTITLSGDQKKRMAAGFNALGIPIPPWDIPALAGAGALRSTLHDMLTFARANLSPETTELAQAIKLAHKSKFTIRAATEKVSQSAEIGLGWQITIDRGGTILWHNGMTGGYASYMALVPSQHWGVVVIGNTACDEIDKVGEGLLINMLQGKLPRK